MSNSATFPYCKTSADCIWSLKIRFPAKSRSTSGNDGCIHSCSKQCPYSSRLRLSQHLAAALHDLIRPWRSTHQPEPSYGCMEPDRETESELVVCQSAALMLFWPSWHLNISIGLCGADWHQRRGRGRQKDWQQRRMTQMNAHTHTHTHTPSFLPQHAHTHWVICTRQYSEQQPSSSICLTLCVCVCLVCVCVWCVCVRPLRLTQQEKRENPKAGEGNDGRKLHSGQCLLHRVRVCVCVCVRACVCVCVHLEDKWTCTSYLSYFISYFDGGLFWNPW